MVSKWAVDCGRLVRLRRQELGWDRRTLAQLVGTTEPTMLRIEAGSLNPRDYMKFAIAAALATEVQQLWPFPARIDIARAASIQPVGA